MEVESEFYRQFLSVVETQLANPELSVVDLAGRMGLSRVQFYRKIKALTNYSPAELLRVLRLKRAATLLKTTERTVAEISYAVGFSSPSYFARCYKDYFGESPTEVQERTSKIG
jgi:transcriptional regulator GlxA family with amidase domain